MKRYKRRNFFIKKDMQGKYILGYFLLVMGGCLFFIALLTFFSSESLTITYTDNDLQFGNTPLMLLRQILTANWVFLVIGGAVVVIVAMLMTHRIAGPMFRLERALDNMLDRNLNDTIFLRSKDEGKELANKINRFNAELSSDLFTIQQQAEAIQHILDTAPAPSEKDDKAHPVAQEQLQEHCRKIISLSGSYELKHD